MKLIIACLLIGSFSQASTLSMTRISGTHTVSSSEVVTTCSSHGYNITLPSCSGTNDGEYHIFKNVGDSSTIEIDPNGTDTIDGSNAFAFGPVQSDTFVCDGTNHNWVGTATY